MSTRSSGAERMELRSRGGQTPACGGIGVTPKQGDGRQMSGLHPCSLAVLVGGGAGPGGVAACMFRDYFPFDYAETDYRTEICLHLEELFQ